MIPSEARWLGEVLHQIPDQELFFLLNVGMRAAVAGRVRSVLSCRGSDGPQDRPRTRRAALRKVR